MSRIVCCSVFALLVLSGCQDGTTLPTAVPIHQSGSSGGGSGGGSSSGSGGGYGGSGRSGGASSGEPHFLAAADDAPTIANPYISFWAKKGEARTVEMVYHARPGATDSTVFFSIRLKEGSLAFRPDGTPIAEGDSVLITLTLVDAERLIVDCQPAGLRFSVEAPVRIKISFLETDDDVNGDGKVNNKDSSLTDQFSVWRKETPTAPWYCLPSRLSGSSREVETDIGGFTSYAVAY